MNVKQEFLKLVKEKNAEFYIGNSRMDPSEIILSIYQDDRQFSEGKSWLEEEELIKEGIKFLNEVNTSEWNLGGRAGTKKYIFRKKKLIEDIGKKKYEKNIFFFKWADKCDGAEVLFNGDDVGKVKNIGLKIGNKFEEYLAFKKWCEEVEE